MVTVSGVTVSSLLWSIIAFWVVFFFLIFCLVKWNILLDLVRRNTREEGYYKRVAQG